MRCKIINFGEEGRQKIILVSTKTRHFTTIGWKCETIGYVYLAAALQRGLNTNAEQIESRRRKRRSLGLGVYKSSSCVAGNYM